MVEPLEPVEKRGGESGADQPKQPLKLWLRLLTCSNIIEKRVRENLRREFGTTLPRFDVMATLEHAGRPLTMGELSARLMVSNGNVTGIVTRLESEGLVVRRPDERDKRTWHVELTGAGLKACRAMARRHEAWINDLLAGLSATDIADMLERLGGLRHSLEAGKAGGTD